MPPRLITAAILAFWLAMTGWLIQKEVVPMMLADVSPSFDHDLTDEIGSPPISWTILRDGQRIGFAFSFIRANEDRSFSFYSSLSFDHFEMGPVKIKKIESMYRLAEDKKLQAIGAKFTIHLERHEWFLGVEGDVANDVLTPVGYFEMPERYEQKLDPIDLSQQGSIVNPMHLVNRLKRLREGQIWKIKMLDPLSSLKSKFLGDIKTGSSMPILIAEVKLDKLTWDKKEIACYVIEYREIGKDVTARTWARKSDGLVVRQEASHVGFEMVLQRVP